MAQSRRESAEFFLYVFSANSGWPCGKYFAAAEVPQADEPKYIVAVIGAAPPAFTLLENLQKTALVWLCSIGI